MSQPATKDKLPIQVFILSAVGFFVALGYGLIIPALPLFAEHFHANNTQVGAIIASFGAARFLAGLITGKLLDLFGIRAVLTLGLLELAVSMFLTSFSQNFIELLIFRTIGGLGSSMFSVSVSAEIMRTVKSNYLGRAQSLYSGTFIVGTMSGPLFGGLLVGISLRAPFFIYAITSIAAAGVSYFRFNSKSEAKIEKNVENKDLFSVRKALQAFPYLAALIFTFSTNFAVFGPRNSIVPLYVTNHLKASNFTLGVALAFTVLAQGLFLIPAGKISDKAGRRVALFLGAGSLLIGILLATFIPRIDFFFISMAFYGAGAAFMTTAGANLVGDLFGGIGGKVIAFWQMSGDLAMVLAPLIIGFISDISSYQMAFGSTALVIMAVLILVFFLPETRKEKDNTLSIPQGRE